MATITEDYCSKELSLLLDKKGFDGYSTPHSKLILSGLIPHSVAMKWLREEHNIAIEIWCCDYKWRGDFATLPKGIDLYTSFEGQEYDTYEQVCEAAIKYCLENLI